MAKQKKEQKREVKLFCKVDVNKLSEEQKEELVKAGLAEWK